MRSSPFVCISDCVAALRGMTSSERHSKPCRNYSLIGSGKASLRLHTTVWRVPTLVDKGFFEFKVCFFPRDIGVRISSKTPVISGYREIAYGSVVVLVIELASSSVGIPSSLNLRCISSGLSSAARMPLPGLKKCMEIAKLCGFPTPCSACNIFFSTIASNILTCIAWRRPLGAPAWSPPAEKMTRSSLKIVEPAWRCLEQFQSSYLIIRGRGIVSESGCL